MSDFKVGDRVYHLRKGDPIATQGYGRLTIVNATNAEIQWEETGKTGFVEIRALRLVHESEQYPPDED
jgi:hypothetical protein